MSVFDASTRVRIAVADPRTDRSLPHPRKLDLRCVNQSTALHGTTGQHCEMVHGDHQEETAGTFTDNIARHSLSTIRGHEIVTVLANQEIAVGGNHKETFASRCDQTILGPHLILNGTVRNETRLGAYTEVYGKLEMHDTQSGHTVTGAEHDERFVKAFAKHGLDLQCFGMALSLAEASLSITGISVSPTLLLDFTLAFLHMEATLLHAEAHPLHKEDHDA